MPLIVLAAGSLKAALTDYAATLPQPPRLTFGPAGLLRQAIADGQACNVFLSADTAHPAALGGTNQVFARNPIHVVARRDLALRPDTLVDRLLDPAIRLGTSTPGADPSGDYAQALFARVDQVRPSAGAALRAKALPVVGAAIPAPGAPAKEGGIAALFAAGVIDAFICYRSSARLLAAQLDVIVPPPPLDVVATYALTTLIPGAAARSFVAGLLAPTGQAILARHGFDPRPPEGPTP